MALDDDIDREIQSAFDRDLPQSLSNEEELQNIFKEHKKLLNTLI